LSRTPGTRSFGEQLKTLRVAAGYTQEELATIAGLSVHAVSALERGARRHPHVETVRALSAALDLAAPDRDAFVASSGATAEDTAVEELSGVALPLPLTALIGRDAEMQVLRDWLADPATRLITLVGPGGVGKTRLALELARAMADEGATRVAFASLAPVRDATLVATSIAEALGLGDVTERDLPARARVGCEAHPTVLVLDNFEHLLEAAPLVADLLASASTLRLLVTSRASLRIRGEREYGVGPLALDADSESMTPAELARVPAVRLFVERVRDVHADFHLTSANAGAVTAVCRRLDALPLALELAAPWVKALAAEGLLRRLERDGPLSTAGPRDLPERQQTINATVAWSYQLLSPDEQWAFRRFGALPGPFPIDAADAVLASRTGGSAPAGGALAAVASLIDKSLLLRLETSAAATRPLFYMLETVRAYAALELAASGERDDALEGLARYATAEASRAETGLRGPAQVEWLDRVRQDLETYRGALAWLIDRGRPAEASGIASGLMFFWTIRGHAAEGLRWYEQILNRPSLPPAAESTTLLGAGTMRYARGEVGPARAALIRALDLARGTGDLAAAAQAENLLGRAEHSLGNVDAARELFVRSVERFRGLALPWGLGNSLTGMATVHLATGDTASAERLLDEAASVLRPGGPWFLALTPRAVIALRRGNADDTMAIVRENLTLIRAVRDKYAFVYALGPLAAAAAIKGKDSWAARILGARDAVTERTGSTVVVRQALDEFMEQTERDVRARLGPERWASAHSAGRSISIDSLMKDIDRALARHAPS
jgi:predicted ATPase/DNA-binding XRE family transcriptional regulator